MYVYGTSTASFLHAQCFRYASSCSHDGSPHPAPILCPEQGQGGRAGEEDREETEPGGPDEAEVGTVIIACRQSRGKGRRQRRWHSPRGGIWLSVILPEIDAEMATVLSLGASVALAASIRYVLNKETSLKWPNDILYKGKKLAGIITDADIMSDRLENIVLGIGINVNVNPLEIDAKIAGTENCIGAACIRAPRGATVRLIQDMLRRIQDMLAMIQQKKTGQIISAWNEISSTIGQTVSAGGVKGTALRIDQDGSLVLKLKSGMVRITADDVVHEHATGHTAIHSS